MNTKALIGVIFVVASNASANEVILDSTGGFSNTQGLNGWSYGYYNGNEVNSFSPDDFEELTEFNGSRWTLQTGSGGFWTGLSDQGGHPNGISSIGGRQSAEHWAVRRWKSDFSGTITLEGKIFKSNTNGGNGVVAHIFVDGKEIFSQYISGQDGVGIDYSFDVKVNTGTKIDFAIDPFESQHASDGTIFTVKGSIQNSQLSEDCWAVYENGKLHIPCVKVKGAFGEEIKYEVDMQYKSLSEPMSFEVTGAKQK